MISTALSKLFIQFPALQNRNYRFYFCGQLVTFTGMWLHGVAHGWLVFELTQSPFWLGVVTAVSGIPVLVLSLFGGFLVDRFNRKKILYCTQSASLILAFCLGLLTISGHITLPTLLILTLLAGVANAIDNPASQAFVMDIVEKKHMPSAIGLNSTMFNTGRVLGPAAAGFLIALVGVGNIFFISSLSFIAILVSLYFIKAVSHVAPKKEKPINAIKEGIRYSYSHPLISSLLLTAGMGAVFCFSQATLMPVMAQQVFAKGAQGLGLLLSSMGLGALSGALILSSQSGKIKSSKFIAFGCIIFLISAFSFSFTSNLYVAMFLLFAAGMGLTLQFTSIYTTIQKEVKDEFRGRVSSIYVLLFIGFSPLGNLFIGSAASYWGPQMAIRLCTFIIFIYAVVMFIHLDKIRLRYRKYNESVKPALSYIEK